MEFQIEKSFVPALTLKTTNDSQCQLVSFHSPPSAPHKMSTSESEDDFLKSLSSHGLNDNHPFSYPSHKSSPSGGIISHPSDHEEDSQHNFMPTLDGRPSVDPTLTIAATTSESSGSQELPELAQCIKQYKSLSEHSEADLDKYAMVSHHHARHRPFANLYIC
jgi:hypothetical protein